MTTPQESEVGRQIRELHAATGLRLVIDADCPACGWPEWWFNGDDFGCNKCDYRSRERNR